MSILSTSDMARSVRFYRRLGFDVTSNCDTLERPGFFILQRGDVTLGLQQSDQRPILISDHWAIYIYVSDLMHLHQEFSSDYLNVSTIRRQTTHACDEFDIADPDRHLIAFAQDRDPDPGPGLSHRRGRG